MSDLFRNSLFKVDRAKKHIADLNAAVLALQDSYASSVEHNSETGVVSLKFDSPVADHLITEIALILGDAIHNLRTSLDYAWVAALHKINPAIADRYTKFPFRNTLQELDAAMNGRNINVVAPVLFNGMRNDIKPYRGGDDSLFRLHELDIADKHLLLTPVVSYSSISGGTVEDETGRLHDLNTIGIHGDGPFYVTFVPGYKIKDHGHISVNVLFDQGAAVPQWEVLSVLQPLPFQVTNVLTKIDSWI